MASFTGVLVPLEEHLHSSYRPDRDWIDGKVSERNAGHWHHSGMQGFLVGVLGNHAAQLENPGFAGTAGADLGAR